MIVGRYARAEHVFDERNMETCSANEFMLTMNCLFRIIKILSENYRELNIDESAD